MSRTEVVMSTTCDRVKELFNRGEMGGELGTLSSGVLDSGDVEFKMRNGDGALKDDVRGGRSE